MTYQYPDVGAFYEGNNQTSFIVWAPDREHLDVVVEDKIFPMAKDERGYWRVTLADVPPGTAYFIRINKKNTFPDPASLSQPHGVHGPSVVADRFYSWTDSSWKGIPLGDMIIYELHVGTFTASGNFDGVISKLDYLKSLGINAIELMPVAQFPGERNWGYDGVFPFAVQHSYGGYAGLKKLVDEAHNHDIAVILDVVYNHQGPEGNYFSAYGPYFTDKYKTFWGDAINFDDAGCDGVRHFYWQNALMWLSEFHIDGLRMDAVHAIWDFSAKNFVEVLREKVAALESQTGRKKVTIAEFDLNNPRYIDPLSRGGYGLDGQWMDEFHHALHSLVTGEVNGYYEDFGEPYHFAKSLKDSYVYTGEYSKQRKKHFGKLPKGNPYSQFVVFAQNHDQVGNRLSGERLTQQLSFEGLKLTAASFLLSPHVPMLFMGEEYGEKNSFQYFISHTDEKLVTQVREGRKKEFSYFKWSGEVPDPQGEDTFRQCILSWDHDRDPKAKMLLAYYKFLIHFRKAKVAMKGVERDSVTVLPVSGEAIISFERRFQNDYVLVVLNFSKHKADFDLPLSQPLKKIFDSSTVEWSGPGEITPRQLKGNKPFTMNPQSAVIFEL